MAIRKPGNSSRPSTPELHRAEQLIADIAALKAAMLERRGGKAVEVDDLLAEMRGYTD